MSMDVKASVTLIGRCNMLVLTRQKGQSVAIRDGDKLIAEVFFLGVSDRYNKQVKLGFRLPSAEVAVWREEIDPEKCQALQNKLSEQPPA